MKPFFKLKLNGKTVGYMRWIKDVAPYYGHWQWSEYGNCYGGIFITHDSIHPYVYDDKNGKPVFEGDKCNCHMFTFDGGEGEYTFIGTVRWDDSYHGFLLRDSSEWYEISAMSDEGIELIDEVEE